MILKTKLVIISLMFALCSAYTQYRYELGLSADNVSYLGDANQNTPFANSNWGFGGVFRYNYNYQLAQKVQISKANVSIPSFTPIGEATVDGKDVGLWDMTTTFEYNFFPFTTNNEYGASRFTPYAFAGLGLSNTVTNQDFIMSMPFGVGLKYKLARNVNFGTEVGMRKLFSDNLDDITDEDFSSNLFINNDYYSMVSFSLTISFGERAWKCCQEDGLWRIKQK